MNPLLRLLLLTFITLTLASCDQNDPKSPKIGLIVPLEHPAMTEIVNGFTETLATTNKDIKIKIKNAEGDPNLQRAIIQQMQNENYLLVAPIGTSTTQMTVSLIKNKPVLGIAAMISVTDRSKLKNCNLALVHDELPVKKLINFIHAVYPQLKQLTLLHSTDDKVLAEVDDTFAAGKSYGITVNHMMINSLPDLASELQAIPKNTEAIFILKDNLMASGIADIAKIGSERNIPVISSDEGSVETGAGFALGVKEKDIGVAAAKLAAEILQGKDACQLPIGEMKNLTVFVNPKNLNQNIDPVINAAKKLNYNVIKVGE